MAPKVFVVGGTGAQGIPIIQGLVKDGAYSVRILTRNIESRRAKELAALGDVELVQGTFTSESDLRTGFRGCQYAFVNIDGFSCGEKAELYWAIRSYELALEEGIKFFVYGNLEYVYKQSGYNPMFKIGHYDGKGRVGEWILQQTKDNKDRMGAALFTTGPYIEMTVTKSTIMTPTVEDGIVTWRVPLGKGEVAHVSLDDCEHYVRWLFDNQDKSNGLDLQVAIDHIGYDELARAFENVTGHPAQYIDTDFETYWSIGTMGLLAKNSSAVGVELTDSSAVTFENNFTGFWNLWRHSAGNSGIITRDYSLLDKIHPGRIKTAEEWMRREDAKGKEAGHGSLWDRVQLENLRPILKGLEDGRRVRQTQL